jgi:hypothetical protein
VGVAEALAVAVVDGLVVVVGVTVGVTVGLTGGAGTGAMGWAVRESGGTAGVVDGADVDVGDAVAASVALGDPDAEEVGGVMEG